MKYLLDQEINLDTEDLLNAKWYATALQEAILQTDDHKGFVIGLFGEWGSGKSSVIKTVRENLEQEKDAKIKFITYDAWKYANDSFRRMFLLDVQRELNFERTSLFESFYTNKNSDVKINRKTNWWFLIYTAVIFLVGFLMIQFVDSPDLKITLSLIVAFLAFGINILGKAFSDYKVSVSEPMIFAPEQFEECFNQMVSVSLKPRGMLNKLIKWVKGDHFLSGLKKIIIVIDNIDRCPSDVAYELITTAKNFLLNNPRIVFVIPMDDEALRKHIVTSSKGDSDTSDADEFLRKIFNITIRIKPYKTYDIFDFANAVNRKFGLNLSPTSVDIVSKEFATNPRRIIQFYNNLITELSIQTLKNGKEFVALHESVICKLLILREEWSDFYSIIAENPVALFKPENFMPIIKNDDPLKSFLAKTQAIQHRADLRTIERILSNRTTVIPAKLIEAIESHDYETLEKTISDEPGYKEPTIEFVTERLDKAFERGTVETDGVNYFECVCYLGSVNHLNQYENVRIRNIIEFKLPLLIPIAQNSDLVIGYNSVLITEASYYLNYFLISYFQILKNNKEKNYNSSYLLFINYLSKTDSEVSMKQLTSIFQDLYFEKDLAFEEIGLYGNRLKWVLDDTFLGKLIENVKFLEDKDRRYLDLYFYCKSFQLSEPVFGSLYFKLNDGNMSFQPQNKDDMLFEMSNFSAVIKTQFSKNLSSQSLKWIQDATENIFKPQKIGNQNQQLTDFIESDKEAAISVEYILDIYRITSGKFSFHLYLERVTRRYGKEYLFDRLLNLKDQEHLNLLLYKDIVLDEEGETEALLLLQQYFLTATENEMFLTTDEEVITFTGNMLTRVLETDSSPELMKFLDTVSSNERISKSLIDDLSGLSEDQIIRLSDTLVKLILNQLATKDKIFDYASRPDILRVIASKGNQSQLSALVKVIIVKLQKDESLREGLSLLDNMETGPSSGDKKKILSSLEPMEDHTDMELIKKLISKFK